MTGNPPSAIILIASDSLFGTRSACMAYRYAKKHDVPAYVEYISAERCYPGFLNMSVQATHGSCLVCVDSAVTDLMPYAEAVEFSSRLDSLRNNGEVSILQYNTLHELSTALDIPVPNMTTDEQAHAAMAYMEEPHG